MSAPYRVQKRRIHRQALHPADGDLFYAPEEVGAALKAEWAPICARPVEAADMRNFADDVVTDAAFGLWGWRGLSGVAVRLGRSGAGRGAAPSVWIGRAGVRQGALAAIAELLSAGSCATSSSPQASSTRTRDGPTRTPRQLRPITLMQHVAKFIAAVANHALSKVAERTLAEGNSPQAV